jgi:hypothetical protein
MFASPISLLPSTSKLKLSFFREESLDVTLHLKETTLVTLAGTKIGGRGLPFRDGSNSFCRFSLSHL